jgi:hypothetical protein
MALKTVVYALLLCCLVAISFAQTRQLPCSQAEHNHWLADALNEIMTIKVGMTRAQLLEILQPSGGFQPITTRTFTHRSSPYIKVDVVFEVQSKQGEGDKISATDKIVSISRPYLELPRFD